MLPSDTDAHHYIGDIVEEIDKALAFVEGMDVDIFVYDIKTVYAVKCAVQNAVEACVHLNSTKANKGQFERLFPGFAYKDIKYIADSGRHDYGNTDPRLLWNELKGRLMELRNAAERLLKTKRK